MVTTPSLGVRSALRAGAASIDITPPVGSLLQGYDVRRARTIADPLVATALAVGADGVDWLLIDADVIGLDRFFVRQLRRRIARRLGIDPSHITIACSHTHSGPATLARLGPVGADASYLALLRDRITDVAEQAVARLQPVRWRFGMASLDENVNRRQLVGERVELGVDPSGPVDHRLRVLRLDPLESPTPSAVLVHYACHATASGAGLDVSGDWPGAMRRCVQDFYETRGNGPVVHFLQGCSGDITHRIGRDHNAWPGHFGKETATEAGVLGRLAGKAAIAASEQATAFDVIDVRVETAAVALPFLGRRDSEKTDVQVVRIGAPAGVANADETVWLVGLPGEPFSEYGTRFSAELHRRFAASPDRALICGYTNDCIGYFCTAAALGQGGYEADTAHRIYHRPASFAGGTESILLGCIVGAAEALLAQPTEKPQSLWHSLAILVRGMR